MNDCFKLRMNISFNFNHNHIKKYILDNVNSEYKENSAFSYYNSKNQIH